MIEPLDIVVALLIRNGHVLITRRDPLAHQGGLWEFPGGKLEAGETLLDCLRREVFEETGVKVGQAEPFHETLHHYPDRSVRLHFFLCPVDDNCCPLAGRWIEPAETNHYTFPAANRVVLERLAARPCK